MRERWTAAPVWLRVLCVLGVVWALAGFVLGALLLLLPGPGLLVLMLAAVGGAPWLALAVREV